MSDLNTIIILGSVFLTSIWSLVCLEQKKPVQKTGGISRDARPFVGNSRINAEGILTMTPPLEQLRAADF